MQSSACTTDANEHGAGAQKGKMTTITQLQNFIKRKRNRRHPMPYKDIALEISERYGDGSYFFTPGQLSLIKDGKWDPEIKEIRDAYNLGPRRCSSCHQKIRPPRARSQPVELSEHQRWWRGLTPEQRNDEIKIMFMTERSLQRFEKNKGQL